MGNANTNTPAADPAATAPAAASAATPAPKASKAKAVDAVSSTADAAPEAPAFSAWYPISGCMKPGTYNDPVTGKRFMLKGGEVRVVRLAAAVDIAALESPKANADTALALMNDVGRRRFEIDDRTPPSSNADTPAAPAADAPAASA